MTRKDGRTMRQANKSHSQTMGAGRSCLKAIFLAATLALPLAGCIGYDGDLQTGYVMDSRLLEQVRTGSSAEQVLVVLGSPSTTSTIGGSAWYYISSKTSQSLAFQKQLKRVSKGLDMDVETHLVAGEELAFVPDVNAARGYWPCFRITVGLLVKE